MILVTGATGTVGGALVSRLSSAGAPVRALVRTRERGDNLRGFDVDLAVGDYDDPEALRLAVRGVERVFLVTRPGPRMAEQELAVVRAVQEEAPQAQVVKLAAAGVDADDPPPVRFLAAHRQVVGGLADAGLATTVLAPTSFMQNLLGQAASVQDQGVLYGAAGDGALAHVDARDVAAVAAHVLTSDGHVGATYTLTGPEALTYAQVAEAFSAVLGRQVRYVDVEPEALREQLVAGGWDEWVAGGMQELSEHYRRGAERPTDEVEKATGRRARGLEQFVTEHRGVFA